jgi:DNA-binding NarL/FixJ family response regulator
VLVADDHPVFRKGLCALLESLDEFEVVGEAADGEQCVAAVVELRPDVVVMDLNMPVLNGVDATRLITTTSPDVAVLVLTMLDADESVFAAMKAGARGYVVKGADTADVVRAIESVANGDAVFGPAIASRVLAHLTSPRRGPEALAFPELTDRERELLGLLARGLSNPEIARRLVISPKTVRNHVTNIFAKLHAVDRADVVRRARAAGLGGDATR